MFLHRYYRGVVTLSTLMANDKHKADHIIDAVFYCGINNVITVAGIVGNVILLVIFMRPHLIRHRSILHTYLKVCHFF